MSPAFLNDGTGPITVLLAHGAGGPMDSDFMSTMATELAASGLRVVRFEFGYMAGRRVDSKKRPPSKVEVLQHEFRAAIDALATEGPLIIGGKSMGGRVASLVADELFAAGQIAGLLCLGYPFHPPGKPEKVRTAHLEGLQTPTLICQGTRDPFGTAEDVAEYALSPNIQVAWLEDGNHDLKPRLKMTGQRHGDHIQSAAQAAAHWARGLA